MQSETTICPIDAAYAEYDRQQLIEDYHARGAEIERLRAALRGLMVNGNYPCLARDEALAAARAALGEEVVHG